MEYAEWSVVFGEQPNTTKWNLLGGNDAYFNQVLTDGWVNPDESWNYASASTFTVTGDQTSKYHRGVKIKLTQSATVKYFVVVTSVYSAPNTTVTVADAQGGSVYTVANSAITANYFSLVNQPAGWPAAASGLSYDTGDGWQDTGEDWSFNAADAPSYTVTLSGDKTTKYYPGMRVKLTHSAAVKYFIITKATYSSPNTTLTLYGGTDYTLAASTITSVFYSREYAPAGFPTNPLKWTIETSDTSTYTQAAPTQNTWYNALSFAIPVGAWDALYGCTVFTADNATRSGIINTTLSTTNNGETDSAFRTMSFFESNGGSNSSLYATVTRQKTIFLTTKTTHYLNFRNTDAGVSTNGIDGGQAPTIVRLRSAYI